MTFCVFGPASVKRGGFKSVLPALVAAGLALASAPAAAQTAPPAAPSSAAQTPRQELSPAQTLPPPAAARRRDDDLLAPPEAGPCPLAGSSLRFQLKAVEFLGADKIRPRELAPTFQADLGRQIGLAEVCRIRDRAGYVLFRRGVLARVEVPEQRIEGGRLQLRVIEAQVVSVQVRGDAGPAQERVETYVDQLRGMRPFDIRKAQRYLLLASDIPGVRVSAALRPAEQGAGAVDLIVSVSRKAIDVLANVQNYGSAALGPVGGVARIDLNGFSRYGERTSLIAYSTLGNADQRVVQVLSDGRLGAEGLIAHGSLSYAWSAPGGELAPLKLQGRSLVFDAGASYPLIRARRVNVNLGGGFDLVDQRTVFGNGGGVLSEDHLRVLFVHLDAERQWRSFGFAPGGALGGDIDFRRGLDALGASAPGGATLSRIGGRADGSVVRGDAHLNLALTQTLSARVVFAGQYAPGPLLAYEQFAVGNLTIGRGYDPSALTGDQGAAGSLELHAGPFAPPQSWTPPVGVNASAMLFYDVAAVLNREVGGVDRTLHSAGAGVSFQLTSRAHLDVSYAKAFDKPSEFSPDPPGSRVLVSLTMSIL